MRTHRFLIPLFAVALAAACDKSKTDDKQANAKVEKAEKADKKTDDTDKPPEAKPEEPKPVLALGAAKIYPKGQPEKAIELGADGNIKIDPEGKNGWKIGTDGKLTTSDGKVAAEVGADGAVTIGGKNSGIVLNDQGLTLTSPDGKSVTIRFGEDGVVQMEPPPAPGLEMGSEGCKPPVAKTCALVLAMYLLSAEGPGESSSAAAAEVPDTEKN